MTDAERINELRAMLLERTADLCLKSAIVCGEFHGGQCGCRKAFCRLGWHESCADKSASLLRHYAKLIRDGEPGWWLETGSDLIIEISPAVLADCLFQIADSIEAANPVSDDGRGKVEG